MLSTIVFWAFVGWAVIQVMYAAFLFLRFFRLPAHNDTIEAARMQGVSIVICAKNEAENLRKHLPGILTQNYSNNNGILYEVIVVNDCSDDATHEVLADLQKQYTHLREVIITPDTQRTVVGKKFALSTGVNNATHNWILLTDADCEPASDSWLARMVAPLAHGKEIVAGYAAHKPGPGMLNKFIRWETTHTFLQLSTYAMIGKPYLAIGRNLACTKAVCLRTYNSPLWTAGPTGDDDLLVKESATKNNMALVTDPAAHTYSIARESLGTWRKQKQRHTSDGKHYRGAVQVLLSLYGISQAAVWVYFVYLAFTPYWQVSASILLGRCVIYWLLWAGVAIRLKEKNIIYLLPLFDIGWMLYNFAFLPYILQKNKLHWT